MVTASRMPVPLPMAPIKSAMTVNNPMHIPTIEGKGGDGEENEGEDENKGR